MCLFSINDRCNRSVLYLDNPVDVQLNKCGDPVANEEVCELLQKETCICNDPDIRNLCEHYCNNKCLGHPYNGSTCVPAVS